MLTEDKIIRIYCIIDDILKGINHQEDVRRKLSDSEVITTALVSALYFGGHFAGYIGGRITVKLSIDRQRGKTQERKQHSTQ